ncbi:hypothetical protein [Variovorax defluvii]
MAQHDTPQGAGGLLKSWVRRCARMLFRLGKPVVRPVAFRFRAYLGAPLQAELQQLRQNLAQERAAQRRWRDATERTLATHTQLLQELRSMGAARPAESAKTALHGDAASRCGLALLLSRLLASEPLSITRIDPRRDSEAALRRAASLLADAESAPDGVLIIAWPGHRERQALPNAADWLRFFAQPGIAVGVIHPETGALGTARLDLPGERGIDLLVTPADAKAWTLARHTA